jgi:phi13 family phage major tail protein
MATRIGCDNLVYALLLTDPVDGNPTYDDVVDAPGVMSLNINPNPSLGTLFSDDGPSETAATLGNVEVEIQKNALTTKQKSDLLGHQIDSNGGLVYGANDEPPWVAIGFRTLKSNGKYKYVWLYKGKFMEPEEANETKGDNINFQADTIKGQFVKVNKTFTINSKGVTPWKYEIDEEHDDAVTAVIDAWFDSVTLPSEV